MPNCPIHGLWCPGCSLAGADVKFWERPLKDGGLIYGVTGDGTHTHEGVDKETGRPFVLVKVEKTGKHVLRWDF